MTLLDPSLDVGNMAPSTLILTLRKQRREAKRQQRSEARRSNLRASTLKTEQEVLAKEQQAAAGGPSRKGRRAQHEGGEVRGVRPMTQDELIAQALEEEERNKEELRTWLRREEEKRELRRVGRKVVRGPKWTWVSRTVGKLVEVVEEQDAPRAAQEDKPPDQPEGPSVTQPNREPELETVTPAPEAAEPPAASQSGTEPAPALDAPDRAAEPSATPAGPEPNNTAEVVPQPPEPASVDGRPAPTAQGHVDEGPRDPSTTETANPSADTDVGGDAAARSAQVPPIADRPGPEDASSSKQPMDQANPTPATSVPQPGPEASASTPATATHSDSNPAEPTEDAPSGPYARNYLMLSQVAGGLASELKIILGDHVDWDDVKYIPARNRPMSRSHWPRRRCCADTPQPNARQYARSRAVRRSTATQGR